MSPALAPTDGCRFRPGPPLRPGAVAATLTTLGCSPSLRGATFRPTHPTCCPPGPALPLVGTRCYYKALTWVGLTSEWESDLRYSQDLGGGEGAAVRTVRTPGERQRQVFGAKCP